MQCEEVARETHYDCQSTSTTSITGSYPNSLANSLGRLPAGARSCRGALVIARLKGLFLSKSYEGLDYVATGSLFARSDTRRLYMNVETMLFVGKSFLRGLR